MIQLILCILILISLIIYSKFTIENFYAATVATNANIVNTFNGNTSSTTSTNWTDKGDGKKETTTISVITPNVPTSEIDSKDLDEDDEECDFDYTKKTYDTLKNCVIDCNKNDKCNHDECIEKCWTKKNIEKQKRVNELTKSDSANIRAFSGDSGIKLTWVKPRTLFDIDKYYIVLSSKITNLLEVYILEDKTELVEYYITGLDNDIIYDVFVIVKNKMGSISDKSNTESILTRKESELKLTRTDTIVSDSMGTRSKPNESNRVQQPLYSKNIVYNDIIQTLTKNLGFKPPNGIYNINIY